MSGKNTSDKDTSDENTSYENMSDKNMSDENTSDEEYTDVFFSDKNMSDKNTSDENTSYEIIIYVKPSVPLPLLLPQSLTLYVGSTSYLFAIILLFHNQVQFICPLSSTVK